MNSMAECGVCGLSPEAHASLNHEFSPSGELIPKKTATDSPKPVSLGGVDVVLRMVLIDLGIVTAEDLALKEAQLRDRVSRIASNPSHSADFERASTHFPTKSSSRGLRSDSALTSE